MGRGGVWPHMMSPSPGMYAPGMGYMPHYMSPMPPNQMTQTRPRHKVSVKVSCPDIFL